MIRSKVKLTFHTYVRVSIGLQNLSSVPLNTQPLLISGQLVVFLLNFCWARLAFAFFFFLILIYLKISSNSVSLLTDTYFFSCVAIVSWRECCGPACRDYQGMICLVMLEVMHFVIPWFCFLHLFLQVLGTPTREEIRCMNPNYTDFRFPQIKAHPWHKVCLLLSFYNCHWNDWYRDIIFVMPWIFCSWNISWFLFF